MPLKTRTALESDVLTSFPDNTTGLITPAIMRAFMTSLLESVVNTNGVYVPEDQILTSDGAGGIKGADIDDFDVDAANVDVDTANFNGVLVSANQLQEALKRVDATGIGADHVTFTGSFAAQSSNQAQWYGGKATVWMRGLGSGVGSGNGLLTFDLPGSAALNAAFDDLVAKNLPEQLTFIIGYIGGTSDSLITNRLRIRPRVSPSPQIAGTSTITLRRGDAAELVVTRDSGTISDYDFRDLRRIPAATGPSLDDIEFQNPANATWDASASGTLPSQVLKGYAYQVVNAPTDGSGRYGEVMHDGDYVVWHGETFTSWTTEPHQWGVFSLHDVRRISQLETDFLNFMAITAVSQRNNVARGADYADSAGEIRLKIYDNRSDYDAADLNTTGDIDVFTDPSDADGYLAIRLTGTQSTLASTLPTLFVYSESSGEFTKLFNMSRDFTHEGDYGGESDYLSNEAIQYSGGDSIRIYIGDEQPRFNNPNLDIYDNNLSDALQNQLSAREPWAAAATALFAGASVHANHGTDRITYTPGYSRGIDWRDMAQSTTTNENRFLDTDLHITASHASFEISGFGANLRKLIFLKIQRNDANNSDGALMELGAGQAFIRVNLSNEIQVNTTPGTGFGNESWTTLNDLNGAITLSSGENLFVFELAQVGSGTTWELVAASHDGTNYRTNYHEENNVYIHPTGAATGDHLGFSRSTAQRGQVLAFSAVNSGGYLLHSTLEDLLRNHRDEKWNFGYSRLIVGSSDTGVVMKHILLESPNGTLYKLGVTDAGVAKLDEVTES